MTTEDPPAASKKQNINNPILCNNKRISMVNGICQHLCKTTLSGIALNKDFLYKSRYGHSLNKSLAKSFVKTAQNSTEVDAKTKESMRKTKEKLDGRIKENHERKKPK